jgi:hypothetical protein
MIKTSTLNDIIRYLYKETNETENRDLEEKVLCDTELLDEYLSLQSMKTLMDKIRKVPSPATMQSILDYSKSQSSDFVLG